MPVYENASPPDEQEYRTLDDLARQLVQKGLECAPPNSVFVEVGVGEGAIYKHIPSPKIGVELRTNVETRFDHVEYGKDALNWKPAVNASASICVICNPPFRQQAAIFNHMANTFAPRGELTVVWIVGLNIRLWTNEDKLDPRMHLEQEWLVPPTMSRFHVARAGTKDEHKVVPVRTCIQVWRRRAEPRRLWNLPTRLSGFVSVYEEPCPRGSLIISRTSNVTQLAKSGIYGNTAWRDGPLHYALTGECVQAHGTCATPTLGTMRRGHGTSMVLYCGDAERTLALQRRLIGLFVNKSIKHLFLHRTSLTIAAISAPVLAHLELHEPETLSRPIEYLDGIRRNEYQW